MSAHFKYKTHFSNHCILLEAAPSREHVWTFTVFTNKVSSITK